MNKKTVDSLREYYRLPDSVSDDDIRLKLRGSLGEAVVNLNVAVKNFSRAVSSALPKIKRFGNHE